jgi:hypothetical protein
MYNLESAISNRINDTIKKHFPVSGLATCESVEYFNTDLNFSSEWSLEVQMHEQIHIGIHRIGWYTDNPDDFYNEANAYKANVERGDFSDLNAILLSSIKDGIGKGIIHTHGYHLTNLNYQVTLITPCGRCYGHAHIHCQQCHGQRTTQCNRCNGNNWLYCPSCGGNGRNHQGHSCTYCGGSGKVNCNYCQYNGCNTCSRCRGSGSEGCPDCQETGYFSKVISFSLHTRPKTVTRWSADKTPHWINHFLQGASNQEYPWITLKNTTDFQSESLVSDQYPFRSELNRGLQAFEANVHYLSETYRCELFGRDFTPFDLNGLGDEVAGKIAKEVPSLLNSNEDSKVLNTPIYRMILDARESGNKAHSTFYPLQVRLISRDTVDVMVSAYDKLKRNAIRARKQIGLIPTLLSSIPFALCLTLVVGFQSFVFADHIDWSQQGFASISSQEALIASFIELKANILGLHDFYKLCLVGIMFAFYASIHNLLLVTRERSFFHHLFNFSCSCILLVMITLTFISTGSSVNHAIDFSQNQTYWDAALITTQMTPEILSFAVIFGIMLAYKRKDSTVMRSLERLDSNHLMRDLGYRK